MSETAFIGVRDGKVFGICLDLESVGQWLAEGADAVQRVPIEVARTCLFEAWPLQSETARSALTPGADALLTSGEQRAQAGRCACRGSDDMCVCQNAPDRQTMVKRAAIASDTAQAVPVAGQSREAVREALRPFAKAASIYREALTVPISASISTDADMRAELAMRIEGAQEAVHDYFGGIGLVEIFAAEKALASVPAPAVAVAVAGEATVSLHALVKEIMIRIENDTTLWTPDWQTWLVDARRATETVTSEAAPVAGQSGEAVLLSDAEKKAQGRRCICLGVDDWCSCQNMPDPQTISERREKSRADAGEPWTVQDLAKISRVEAEAEAMAEFMTARKRRGS